MKEIKVKVCFRKLGRLFKDRGLLERERTESWVVALALVVYHLGASFRQTAKVLEGFSIYISHVAT
jgi:hypothetical protein